MMLERWRTVDHSTICRWVPAYAPELERRSKPRLKPANDSYRVDETYVKIEGQWKYLYRAVDSEGSTIEFMLSARRDAMPAKRFFKKVLRVSHSSNPPVINFDKNSAYPPAVSESKDENILPESRELRQVRYLNNVIEQDHRFIERSVAPRVGFTSLQTANRTLMRYEAMSMIRKGQITKIEKGDTTSRMRFIEKLFGIAA